MEATEAGWARSAAASERTNWYWKWQLCETCGGKVECMSGG